MKNKLPVVGKRYKRKSGSNSVDDEIKILEEIPYFLIESTSVDNKYWRGKVEFSFLEECFEEIPSTTKENYTCSSEVQEALEELKMWLEGANTDLIDKNSDIWQLFKAGQNLINALESKENK